MIVSHASHVLIAIHFGEGWADAVNTSGASNVGVYALVCDAYVEVLMIIIIIIIKKNSSVQFSVLFSIQ